MAGPVSASFAHLHLHTEFSMLDGAARVEEVVKRAASDGQPAIAITDHGNMYGVLDFYKAARAAGVKPVIGIEAYMAGGSRLERPMRRGRLDDTGGDADEGDKLYYHLTLLAENDGGYKNLLKLSSDAYLSGYWYKPRCLLPGQEIVTRDGVKPIETITTGDEVLTHKGRFRRVTHTTSRQHSGLIYGLRLGANYQRVTWMTAEHPVLVRDHSGRLRWVEARAVKAGRDGSTENVTNWRAWVCLPKLRQPSRTLTGIHVADHVSWKESATRPGHFVRESRRKNIGPTHHYSRFPARLRLDYDLGYLMGLYISEGCIERTSVSWYFNREEKHLVDHCALMAERLTSKPATIDWKPDRPGYQGVAVHCSSPILAQLLARLCGSGAPQKHLPSFVYESPLEFQRGLLEGVIDGDGSKQPAVTIFTQTSRDLAWQVRLLRATLNNDFACVTQRPQPSERHALQYRSNYSPERPQRHRKTLADDDYVYKPVSEVLEMEYSGPVYNIEVDEDHSYVSDFAMHNCDWDLLERYHEGVIATTGCLGGLVSQALLRGDVEQATSHAARLQEIFGKENLFVELQDHGIEKQRKTNPQLIEIARHIGAPLLATNDSHYASREDHLAHDALLCVQTGSTMDDEKRFRFEGSEHYLKTAAEMRALFSELPEACDNTLWVAERADVTIELGRPKLPAFALPAPFTSSDEYLRHLSFRGAEEMYGTPVPANAVERLDYELGVIASMGFSDYFLVVWDLIRHAREQKIRVGPGRGSTAGCCVAYCLRIVDLDPLRYDLMFERFLNTGRKQMPDIDMDFDERYRGEMIRYASERWGWDRVAQIVTFSTIKARAAARDAARVLGYPYGLGDRIAKAMPPLVMGRDTPLWACFEEDPKHADGYKVASELREMYATDPDVKRVVDVAKGLEGLRRQDGIHAAAVVISADPLTDHLPVQRKPEPGGRPEDAPIVTQYEMHAVEELGLLKMDFLGLRNLSVVERTLDMIEANTGTRPDIDHVDLSDPATFELLRRGDTVGVFQLEGTNMRALARALAPTELGDLAALVALYRPGPMAANMHNDYADRKNGRKPVTYLHEDMADLLSDTYGLMIYQESMLRVAQRFAGYSLEEADTLRKAAGKKVREIMKHEREKFVAGCERTGYGAAFGSELFDIIEPFADYAFGKSHAFGYGLVAYWTAWLKANHPVEYMACLLTSVKDDKDKLAVYLAECRAMGIEVLVPDINLSASDFTAVRSEPGPAEARPEAHGGGVVPFGLSAIRNVGEGLVDKIVSEREAAGPFKDFYDFCNRVDPVVLNKRTVESLIKAGAFDSLGHPRQGLCLVSEQVLDRTLARRREADQGVLSLFGGLGGGEQVFDDTRVPVPGQEFDKHQKLVFEKEMLGLYVSDHPLVGAEAALRRHTDCTILDLREEGPGREVGGAAEAGSGPGANGGYDPNGAPAPGWPGGRNGNNERWVGGVITGLARRYTRRGELMATFVLEDLESSIEVFVFPRTMTEVGYLLADDVVVCVKGRLDLRDEVPKLVCSEVKRPQLTEHGSEPLQVVVPVNALDDKRVERLRELLREHPGPSPVYLHVGTKVVRLAHEFDVTMSAGLLAELRVLLGPACLWSGGVASR